MTREVRIGGVAIGGGNPLVLIAGPCVIEGEAFTLEVASKLKEIAEGLRVPLVFKASYDKANRTSVHSFRGPGLAEGLRILKRVKEEVGLPVLSDVHRVSEIGPAGEVLDCLQIPAFLSRQTDLILEAASTGLPVNIKKGQFLSPWDMEHAVEKACSRGNDQVLLTERGTFFGYRDLVNDMRSLVIMKGFGTPVIYDATHSVQSPGGRGGRSGGNREFVPALVRAAVAIGVDGLYMEVHPRPEEALSDPDTSWPLDRLAEVLEMALEVDRARRRFEE
ncbi:MAG: 3-deoxy-8-phosphooctulonate synthase [Deltaproteobacteria bacterium]|nr:MAG: 3-deoxy-8-phosphooctulonate synthase [Deltaproteobacteria bacterium]